MNRHQDLNDILLRHWFACAMAAAQAYARGDAAERDACCDAALVADYYADLIGSR